MTRSTIALAALLVIAAALPAQVAVFGETVWTMNGERIDFGVVLTKDGKITAVGSAATIEIPEGTPVLRAKVVTPGLIDAHSVVGLAGQYNQKHDQDQLDPGGAVQPELRALDAFNYRERLVGWLREHGVTTVHTGHAPGALVSGTSVVVKTKEAPLAETVLDPDAMVLCTLGEGGRASGGKSPGTTAKMVAMLRAELVKAREYTTKRAEAKKDKPLARDLRLEALAKVLAREVPVLITVNRERDIMTALRLAKEFDVRLVLDGAAEIYLALDAVKEAGVPVILHPTMARSRGERKNLGFETAAKLRGAGIPFALQSGYESYVPKTRVVLFEAAIAAANGLGPRDALASITIDAARLLGLEKRIGSLEPGKDADLVLFDGDPFEYLTKVTGVVIDGQVVSQTPR